MTRLLDHDGATEPAAYSDPVSAVIEEEAQHFPPGFTEAVNRILALAERPTLSDQAYTLAAERLTPVLDALAHFSKPEVTADALRLLLHTAPHPLAYYARKHGMTSQCMHKRVLRLARFLGVTYRRTKPYGGKWVAHQNPEIGQLRSKCGSFPGEMAMQGSPEVGVPPRVRS
jgi:hypothetical protein